MYLGNRDDAVPFPPGKLTVLEDTMKTITFALTAALLGLSAVTATAATSAQEAAARIDRDRMSDTQWAGIVQSCLSGAQTDAGYCRAVLDVNFDNGDNKG